MRDILERFRLPGAPVSWNPCGNGHINVTYRVECGDGGAYILQRINSRVFRQVPELMRNIQRVTAHLLKKTDDPRAVLSLVETRDGGTYTVDKAGEYWRMYRYVRDSVCLERAEDVETFRESAVAFGRFQDMLSDFPAETLSETIPKFHDTVSRYEAFRSAVKEDARGRAKQVQREIDFTWRYEEFAGTLVKLQQSGQLPLRVTHNDTKLNNVLFDAKTRKALCIIDLDTVMPGLAVNDYGDSIRFGASTAAEDERDLDRVRMDMALFEAYTAGFLGACGANLTALETELLPVGAKMMTLECGVRFLADYLNGDTYFSIHYPEHNLDRCRTQYKLVADMDEKWGRMMRVVGAAARADRGEPE